MVLIERLDALVEQGRRFPGTNNVIVDKVAATDLIEQLRVAVPEEVRQAKRINEESSRLVEPGVREAVCDGLRALGFQYVALDLAGFRSGSLNDLLGRKLPLAAGDPS